MSTNGVIGNNNRLPWHLPEDLRHFKRLTVGHVVVMGRKTYESLPKRLPDRTMVVISRTLRAVDHPGILIFNCLDDALAHFSDLPSTQRLFVIGGAEIYRLGLAYATSLYLTEINLSLEGDTFFPVYPLDPAQWILMDSEHHQSDNGISFCFNRYQRIPA